MSDNLQFIKDLLIGSIEFFVIGCAVIGFMYAVIYIYIAVIEKYQRNKFDM